MPFLVPKLPFKGCDPRRFLTTGRNVGKRFPAININNIRRDVENVQTTVENIGDRLEGAIGAAKRGDISGGGVVMSFLDTMCPPNPWASAFSEKHPPKFPFMYFTVFNLNADFLKAFGQKGKQTGGIFKKLIDNVIGSQKDESTVPRVGWFAKNVARPQITYEYDDVNMYNFRTRVIRRMTYDPISITVYDDFRNYAHDFFNTYHRIQSPIANVGVNNLAPDNSILEDNGMTWSVDALLQDKGQLVPNTSGGGNSLLGLAGSAIGGAVAGGAGAAVGGAVGGFLSSAFGGEDKDETRDQPQYTASVGALPGDLKYTNIIRSIQVVHVIGYGQQFAIYEYLNPRITAIRMSELAWEDSTTPATIEMEFNYDAVDMQFSQEYNDDFVDKDIPFLPWQGAEQLDSGFLGKITGGIF